MTSELERCRDDSKVEDLLTSVAQRMASPEKNVRDKALRNIRRWLERNGADVPLESEDIAKLWRALFVCMWMSDKPLNQEHLAESISMLIKPLTSHDSVMLFLREFFIVMAIKWPGIDKWRFDKFLMLNRRMIRQTFIYGANVKWSLDFVDSFVELLRDTVCKVEPTQTAATPLGLKLHVADLYCEELAKVGINEHLTEEVLVKLFRPYMEVIHRSRDNRFVYAIVKRVFDYLLKQSDPVIKHEIETEMGVELDDEEDEMNTEENDDKAASEEEAILDNEDEEEPSNALDPRAGGVNVDIPQIPVNYQRFHKEFFELASDPSVKQKTRNLLFSFVKKFKDVAANAYPFPKIKQLTEKNLVAFKEKDYESALSRLQKFETDLYTDSVKNAPRKHLRQRKKERKSILESNPIKTVKLSTTPKKKRLERGGRKKRKVSKKPMKSRKQ